MPTDPAGDADHPLVVCFNGVRHELVGTLMHVLGSRDLALDAAQEAFLKCWRGRDRLDGVGNLRAWIFRVALNAAKDVRRSAWRRKSRPLGAAERSLAADGKPVSAAAEDAEAIERLRAAIGDLRPDEREVFLLRQNGELTYEEIARQRGAPVGTVKTQMRAALQKLRAALAEPDPPEDRRDDL